MAITLVQSKNATGVTATSITTPAFSSNTTIGNTLVCWAANWDTTTAHTLAFSSTGQTWTNNKQVFQSAGSNPCYAGIGSAPVAAANTSGVKVQTTGTPSVGWQACAAEFSGITNTVDQSATNVAAGSTTSLTVTLGSATTNANDLLCMVYGADTTTTGTSVTKPTVDGSNTNTQELLNVSATTNTSIEASYYILSSTGTHPVVWSYSSDSSGSYAGVVVAFKGAGTNAGGNPVVIGSGPGRSPTNSRFKQFKLDATPTSSAVSLALTGVTGTGSAGTLGVSVDKPLTGVTGTGSAGTVAPSASIALTGVSATGSAGTVSVSVDKALTGVTGTGSVGTLGVNVDTALTGVTGTGSVGTVTPSSGFVVALTGVSATGSAGTLGVAVDKALTAVSATGSVGTVSTSATVTLNGVSATGSVGSVGVNVDTALTGLTATGSLGTVTPSVAGDITLALTGVTATGSVGVVGVINETPVAAPAETPAGRSRRVRDIYRVTIDGRRFEFKTLDAALQFLEKAKAAAAKLAREATRKATEKQAETAERVELPKFKLPEIQISSRELRAAASATKREIEVIYEQALVDAEIAMLFELNKRAEDDDEAITWLM